MQDACVQNLAVLLGPDGKVAHAVESALIRSIEDFPVDQLAAAAQPDASAADAAQREGNFAGVFALVDKGRGLGCSVGRFVRWE